MKLNTKRTVLIGFGFMSILAFWQFYDQVIPYILENNFHLSTTLTNIIMAADNVLALFMLPLFGALSDKTRTPLGKRTPYVLFGTIAAVALMVVLSLFNESRNLPAFITALLVLLVVMSTYRGPAVAYMPDVTEKPLRSRANAIINLVGYIGGIFSTVAMMFLLKGQKDENGKTFYPEDQSFIPIFLVVAAFMLVAVIIMVLTVKENKVLAETNIKDDEEETDEGGNAKLSKPVFRSLVFILLSVFLWYTAYNAVTTSFSRYCLNVLGVDLGTSSGYLLAATIVAIAAFVPLGKLSEKIGRKKSILFGIVLMTVCYGIALFIKGPTPFLYVIFGVVGIGWAAINVSSFPMVVEMSRGSDVGKYTGFYYTFSMAAQVSAPAISGIIIDNTSLGYYTLFPFAILFSALSFITMSLVKHGEAKKF